MTLVIHIKQKLLYFKLQIKVR